jgi:hypothetical protein
MDATACQKVYGKSTAYMPSLRVKLSPAEVFARAPVGRESLIAKDSTRVLDPHFVCDARFGQPHELG